MSRQVIVKGHIVHSVNMVSEAGDIMCHILLEGPEGDLLAEQFKAAGVIVDTENPGKSFEAAAARYKRSNKAPLHEFAGLPVSPGVVGE